MDLVQLNKNLVQPIKQTMNLCFRLTSVIVFFLVVFTCKEKADTPVLGNSRASEIGYNYAVINAVVIFDGGAPVSKKGVCWSTSPNPGISDNVVYENEGIGSLSVRIEPLEQKTLYYIRAFAKNFAGVGYSNEYKFTTDELPLFIETRSVTGITANSAISGGIVRRGMGMEIDALGLCWSTHPESTLDDNKTVDGTVMNNFTSKITSLNPATKYYIRTYVISSTGTVFYGNELSFITLNQ